MYQYLVILVCLVLYVVSWSYGVFESVFMLYVNVVWDKIPKRLASVLFKLYSTTIEIKLISNCMLNRLLLNFNVDSFIGSLKVCRICIKSAFLLPKGIKDLVSGSQNRDSVNKAS